MKKNANKRAKPAKKKSPKKSEAKAAKQRRFVSGLIDGKSMRKAALDAGYTESMADKAGEKILPGAQTEFQQELERAIPRARLIKRISEGLDARETKLLSFKGEYTEAKHLVAWSERRRYAELIAKLQGLLIERVEVGTDKPLEVKVDISIARDKLLGKLASS